MVALIDRISPDFLCEQRIKIQMDQSSEPLMPFRRIIVNFDYGDADPEGVVLPLELIVQPAFGGGGAALGYRRIVFRRTAPSSATFTVPSAGQYLLVLREMAHNQWYGRHLITVGGDPISTGGLRERGR